MGISSMMKACFALAFVGQVALAVNPITSIADMITATINSGSGTDACCCMHHALEDQKQSFSVVKDNEVHKKECNDAGGIIHSDIHPPDCQKNCASTIYASVGGVTQLHKGMMNGGASIGNSVHGVHHKHTRRLL